MVTFYKTNKRMEYLISMGAMDWKNSVCAWHRLNSLRPRQNRRHFADDTFKCNFLNENVWIPLKIPLKFVPRGPINNISSLVKIMAWRRPGDKPLSEPMLVFVPTHICVTRPQWVNCFNVEWYIALTVCYVLVSNIINRSNRRIYHCRNLFC